MRSPRLLPELLAALAALAPLPTLAQESEARPGLGLMGTIPVYWGESDGFGDVLGGKGQPHWARAELEKDYRLVPLSYLDSAALEPFALLLLAQPRALSGEENVALDAWVRAGGHLLLFADPMMTGDSRYAIGDRRRPQDVIMLSPILGHWGLRLEIDDLDGEPTIAPAEGIALPVDVPGRFALAEGDGKCQLSETAVLARCRIGQGTATIVADAATLDLDVGSDSVAAFHDLVRLAFSKTGETKGPSARAGSCAQKTPNSPGDRSAGNCKSSRE